MCPYKLVTNFCPILYLETVVDCRSFVGMKKQIATLFVVITCSVILEVRHCTAQNNLSIFSLDISVPVQENFYSYTNRNLDTSFEKDILLHGFKYDTHYVSNADSFYSRIKDSFYFNFGRDMYPYSRITVSFLLDTLKKRVVNFVWDYRHVSTPSYPNSLTESTISFSKLDYYLAGDTIIVRAYGTQCSMELTKAHYYDNYRYSPDTYTETRADNIRDKDTSDFQCLLTLLFLRNSFVRQENLSQLFSVSTTLPDHTIHFSFPASDHAQQMTIYDILGREVSRDEVASDLIQYSIAPTRFRSGHYFVRLGMNMASFEVY